MCGRGGQPDSKALSRRERQIMDLVYELGECSARDIHTGLADAPSNIIQHFIPSDSLPFTLTAFTDAFTNCS